MVWLVGYGAETQFSTSRQLLICHFDRQRIYRKYAFDWGLYAVSCLETKIYVTFAKYHNSTYRQEIFMWYSPKMSVHDYTKAFPFAQDPYKCVREKPGGRELRKPTPHEQNRVKTTTNAFGCPTEFYLMKNPSPEVWPFVIMLLTTCLACSFIYYTRLLQLHTYK